MAGKTGAGWTIKAVRERERLKFGALAQTTRCDCGWEYEGSAEDGRLLAQKHRSAKHPDRPVVTPRMTKAKRQGQRGRNYDGSWA